ncbi:hypothetical protein EVAR_36205_1 [Eumeta japonica]|uniref:Uncharacterized protein n=1 Tax=Eumeta variegata TaxID=151549 RepID=A0A4C1VTC5_EUMVA|nr:hypothetical protein EVAR_36205_1 [Eumeta japonica]
MPDRPRDEKGQRDQVRTFRDTIPKGGRRKRNETKGLNTRLRGASGVSRTGPDQYVAGARLIAVLISTLAFFLVRRITARGKPVHKRNYLRRFVFRLAGIPERGVSREGVHAKTFKIAEMFTLWFYAIKHKYMHVRAVAALGVGDVGDRRRPRA